MPELTLALSAGGAVLGKALGATAASKSVGVITSKAFAGKLGSPFVAKALAASSGAFAGTFAGPLGTLAGAGVGEQTVQLETLTAVVMHTTTRAACHV